jgi:Bacterial protein of unknown function (DUF922)
MSITVVASPVALTWSDFLPVSALPGRSKHQAQTVTQMSPVGQFHPLSANGVYSLPDLTLNVRPDRSQTKVVQTAQKTPELLKHEQGHYDVTVLAVRAMAHELEQLKEHSLSTLGRQMEAVRLKHQQRAKTMEDRYDSDTNHGENKTAQAVWNQAIEAAMRSSPVSELRGMPL